MNAVTHFLEPMAVDAWDAWFRWRDTGGLHDLTIDATWNRVAETIAQAEGRMAGRWAQRFADAFASWQLLPDEHLLHGAGTGAPLSLPNAPAAVLNAAAFIRASSSAEPDLDRDRLVSTAALAVRLLDDALLVAANPPSMPSGLRIGVIGVANTLFRLGLRYDSDAGRQLTAGIAAALAEGCLHGAIILAAERGHPGPDRYRLAPRWRDRAMPQELIADGLHWGVRHCRLTAIQSQPRLALLANNVADALDPILGRDRIGRHRTYDGLPSTGHYSGIERRGSYSKAQAAEPVETLETVSIKARVELRAAVQPWIDAPIEYPFVALQEPDPDTQIQCAALAQLSGLPVPGWRLLDHAAPQRRC